MIRIIKSMATVRKIYGKNVENYSKCCSVAIRSPLTVTSRLLFLGLSVFILFYNFEVCTCRSVIICLATCQSELRLLAVLIYSALVARFLEKPDFLFFSRWVSLSICHPDFQMGNMFLKRNDVTNNHHAFNCSAPANALQW